MSCVKLKHSVWFSTSYEEVLFNHGDQFPAYGAPLQGQCPSMRFRLGRYSVRFRINQSSIDKKTFCVTGTVCDAGVFAPVLSFQKMFENEGVPITDAEARGPMGVHKRVSLLKSETLKKHEKRAFGSALMRLLAVFFRPTSRRFWSTLQCHRGGSARRAGHTLTRTSIGSTKTIWRARWTH